MTVYAPDFRKGLLWLNTDTPLSLKELRGRPVLLDFWTFCCINCMHVLPDLRYFEEKFGPRGLVVIGVHSNKFPHEAEFDAVKNAVHRYDVRHPVVIDEDHMLWNSYGVRAWPTFVLIDGNGRIDTLVSGEGKRQLLERRIEDLLKDNQSPELPLANWKSFDDALHFRFPGKILAAETKLGRRYFVSDSSNNRIVELNEDGRYLRSFGEDFLKNPQGMCVLEDDLYICDTDNHRLVKVALRENTELVPVVAAGKGEPGYFPVGDAVETFEAPLNSPWDICTWNSLLLIACAGSHQLVAFDPQNHGLVHVAGSGVEDLVDGEATMAALAQPSGMCVGPNGEVFFVDSETSSLRVIYANDRSGTFVLETLIGAGLFEYGFQDGKAAYARLQHPLGCAYSPKLKSVLVVDSYNNALRSFSLESRMLKTHLLGTALHEPGGLYVSDGKVFIADTNQHRIIVLNESDLVHAMPANFIEWKGPFGVFADAPRPYGTEHIA